MSAHAISDASQPSVPGNELDPAQPEQPTEAGSGLAGVPLAVQPTTRAEFASNQEVRWCPGCGDYAVLSTFQTLLPDLGIARENLAVISGIGCSSRFPYYMNAYGFHSIHGRALTLATGLATTREDLAVFVMTGDGDSLSIGANHLIHTLRRNVNLTILLFNNRIYGLTKGQYSPTSELGKVTKSSPMGSVDAPLNPISLALGAEASFVARTLDSDREQLTSVIKAAAAHRGSSLVEIYQNCPIYNDGAFEGMRGPAGDSSVIRLVDGQPIIFGGEQGRLGVFRGADGDLRIDEVTSDNAAQVIVHDAHHRDPSYAFALSRLTDLGSEHTQRPAVGTVLGIFRDVQRPTYDDQVREQSRLAGASAELNEAALQAMLDGVDNWQVR